MNTQPKTGGSSGNVFEDLGLPDADERLVKADLSIRIAAIVRKRGLTQKTAAAEIGVDQPRMSDLMRGKLKRFSVYRLMLLLSRLGQTIEIHVRASRSGGSIRLARTGKPARNHGGLHAATRIREAADGP